VQRYRTTTIRRLQPPAPTRTPVLSRRAFLGGAVVFTIAGCSSTDARSGGTTSDPTGSAAQRGSTTLTTTPSGRYSLVALFDSGGGEIAVGAGQRLPLAIGDRSGVLLPDPPGDVTFEVSVNGETVGQRQTVAPRSEGVPRPYYPLRLTLETAGLHQVTATVDGQRAVAAFVVGSSEPPVVPGAPMLSVVTPTVAHHRGVDPICTRQPRCPFHEISLDDALAEDRPVVLLVAAPGHCDSSLCPPALDLLIDAAPRFPSATYVHAEVYADADRVDSLADASPTDVARTYRLTYEPSLMLAGRDGTLAERLDHIYDTTELDEALARLTGGG
jgi:hypothetical protein